VSVAGGVSVGAVSDGAVSAGGISAGGGVAVVVGSDGGGDSVAAPGLVASAFSRGPHAASIAAAAHIGTRNFMLMSAVLQG
jgi:hypothetical protein